MAHTEKVITVLNVTSDYETDDITKGKSRAIWKVETK